jgi:fumarate reductase subunit D
MRKFGKTAIVVGALLLPVLALAQTPPPGPIVTTFGGVQNLLNTAISWIFTLLIILAVIFILYAAFLYLTAAGDTEKVKKANHTLLYAAIAIAVAVLAKSIPVLVGNFIGASVPTP